MIDNSEVRFNSEIANRKTMVLMFLSWLLSIFFVDTVLSKGLGITTPVVYGLFLLLVIWFNWDKGITKDKIALAVASWILSLSFVITYTSITYIMTIAALFYLFLIIPTSISGYGSGGLFGSKMLISGVIGAFGLSIKHISIPFQSLAKSNKGKVIKVLIGLLLAVPAGALFIYLFNQADEVFKLSLDKIIDFLRFDLSRFYYDMIFGTIIGFGMTAGLSAMKLLPTRTFPIKTRKEIFDNTVLITFFSVITAIFLLFIVIQFRYLFNSSADLPGAISFSKYAVSGFYQLCAVVVISSIMIAVAILFVKKVDGKLYLSVKTVLSLMITGNFVVVASAIFRMYRYIDAYDLSIRRLVATWMIVVLTILLVGFLMKIWLSSYPLRNHGAITVFVMLCVLNFSNVNAIVANYNVDKYIESKYKSKLDISYLASLGASAAPALANLVELNSPDSDMAKSALYQIQFECDRHDWRNTTLDRLCAYRYFDKLDIGGYFREGDKKEYFGDDENIPELYELEDPYGYDPMGVNAESRDRNGREVYRWL